MARRAYSLLTDALEALHADWLGGGGLRQLRELSVPKALAFVQLGIYTALVHGQIRRLNRVHLRVCN